MIYFVIVWVGSLTSFIYIIMKEIDEINYKIEELRDVLKRVDKIP